MPVTADDLESAVIVLENALRPMTDRDWTVPAGGLDWDCWHTAQHIGDCLLSYAGQLVLQPDDRYGRFYAAADDGATGADVLEFALAGGRILAAVVRSARPDARAFHPSGRADPEGFAAMGCLETLLHGEDIARGLGATLDPPRDVCTRLLRRMFPDQAAGLADVDPWRALLWCSGRADLPDRARVTDWAWRGAPLTE